jgi:hypothetical protein
MKKSLNFVALVLIAMLSVSNLSAKDISGNVLYQGDVARPIGNVNVTLKNLDNNTTQTVTTTGDGFYQFTNLENGNYMLTGATSIPAGGVTYYDAVMLFLHLAGFNQLSPLQALASDVNNSGSITWADYNLIVAHILNNTSFPAGTWTFEPEYFTLSELKDGGVHGPGGTCTGDIAGTFVPTVNSSAALPIAETGTINVNTKESFTTAIVTKKDMTINSAGIIINYPSDILQIESVEFKGSDAQYNIENGQIRLVWGNPNTQSINFAMGEAIITIHGKGTTEFKKGMTANFSLDGNTSLMNSNNVELTNLSFSTPTLQYGNPSLKLSNYPNPFTTSTKLSIYTPVAGNAVIEVYSTCGQLIKNISAGRMNEGFSEVTLDASQLSKGYYVCKMRISTEVGELSNSVRILKAE